MQLASRPGTTPAQLREAKARFEEQYDQLPSPQWQLKREAVRTADTILQSLEDRVRKEEAAQAAASAAEANRRVEQVRAEPWMRHWKRAELHKLRSSSELHKAIEAPDTGAGHWHTVHDTAGCSINCRALRP